MEGGPDPPPAEISEISDGLGPARPRRRPRAQQAWDVLGFAELIKGLEAMWGKAEELPLAVRLGCGRDELGHECKQLERSACQIGDYGRIVLED